MKQTYSYQDNPFSLDLSSTGKMHRFTIGGKSIEVELVRVQGHRLDLLIDGVPTSAFVTVARAKRWVTINGQTFVLTKLGSSSLPKTHSRQSENVLLARMPGLVRAVLAGKGEQVARGQTLAVVEAMKMENKVTAPFDGRVKSVLIQTGQTVERDQALFELTPAGDEESVSQDL